MRHIANKSARYTTEYRVRWEITLRAKNPRHAAHIAQGVQRQADATAGVFTVHPVGSGQVVDLNNRENDTDL